LNGEQALDSTTIRLCLSLFPWEFRANEAAIKLHTLLELTSLYRDADIWSASGETLVPDHHFGLPALSVCELYKSHRKSSCSSNGSNSICASNASSAPRPMRQKNPV
jgi:hypothetical protein